MTASHFNVFSPASRQQSGVFGRFDSPSSPFFGRRSKQIVSCTTSGGRQALAIARLMRAGASFTHIGLKTRARGEGRGSEQRMRRYPKIALDSTR
jgi:hypothetical protein